MAAMRAEFRTEQILKVSAESITATLVCSMAPIMTTFRKLTFRYEGLV
jgi:hypothetical protein